MLGSYCNRNTTLLMAMMISWSALQSQPAKANNVEFLYDLGIAFDVPNGSETYDRTIPSNSNEIQFNIKQNSGGDTYDKTNKELLAAIERINSRIIEMEMVFNQKLLAVQTENTALKAQLVALTNIPITVPEEPEILLAHETPDELDDVVLENLPWVQSIQITVPTVPAFNKELYNRGMYAYQCGDLATALSCFSELDMESADDSQAENILYWQADAYLQMGEYEQSLAALNMLLKYKKSDMIDDALIKKGILYKETGHFDLAMNTFKKVVVGYPESEYSRLAALEIKRGEKTAQ